MEKPLSGEVVVVNFPYTDFSGFNKRPALVLANLKGEDIILCQITSKQSRFDEYAIELLNTDFIEGNLSINSLIRTNKIFTASEKIILKKIGKINNSKLTQVKTKITEIILS